MKIVVNKCRYTGTLFESDTDYTNHLAALRRERAADRKAANLRNTFFDWLKAEKELLISIDMVVPWILENQRTIMDACNAGIQPKRGSLSFWNGRDKLYPTDKIVELKMVSARYSDSVSNTHSCPDDGVTNWGGQVKGAPRGYPGWQCRFEGKTERLQKHMGQYPSSRILNLVGVKTGTGGGGNESWGYDAEIFLSDWPQLSQELLFNKLKGK